MSRKIEPDRLFYIWRPDQVAECLEGMPWALYSKLWNEIVPLMPPKSTSELLPEGPGVDDIDDHSLEPYWDQFTEEEQVLLNELAVREVGSDS